MAGSKFNFFFLSFFGLFESLLCYVLSSDWCQASIFSMIEVGTTPASLPCQPTCGLNIPCTLFSYFILHAPQFHPLFMLSSPSDYVSKWVLSHPTSAHRCTKIPCLQMGSLLCPHPLHSFCSYTNEILTDVSNRVWKAIG